MNRRRPNQGGAPEDTESVSRNTRSSGNALVAYDDNAGAPRRAPRDTATTHVATGGSAVEVRVAEDTTMDDAATEDLAAEATTTGATTASTSNQRKRGKTGGILRKTGGKRKKTGRGRATTGEERTDDPRERRDDRTRSASPVPRIRGGREDRTDDPPVNAPPANSPPVNIPPTVASPASNPAASIPPVNIPDYTGAITGSGSETLYIYGVPQEPQGQTGVGGAGENNQPSVDVLVGYMFNILAERVLDHMDNSENYAPDPQNAIRIVAQAVIHQMVDMINADRYYQHFAPIVDREATRRGRFQRPTRRNDQLRIPNQVPAASSSNDAGASGSTSGYSSVTYHPQSTASEGQPSEAGDVQVRQQTDRRQVRFNRRMLLQQGTANGENWRTVGHVNWVYSGGRSVDCLYHGLSLGQVPVVPTHGLLLDYLVDAQRILYEFSDTANREDNVGLVHIQDP
ncbi:hypothetical protein BJV82DRAFT_662030 [Fennellomyces sp. T-0311]|nr:hypothetical protein BJV82DRAFT_662030 [Fennellomyces sp. T-0311]